MAEQYFEKFPTTLYKGYNCRDITRRVKIDEQTRNALTLFYLYELKDGTRADLIADAYYEDPTLDWLLWLTNYQVDPYYQWNLSDHDFEDYLVKKYGSVENSIKHIAYYRNNWYDDDNVLTPSFYENNLEKDWKKYYAPFYGENVKILYWKRREEDWLQATNKIYKLSVASTPEYSVSELVDVKNASQTRVGGGEIVSISHNTFLLIKNIDGSFSIGNEVIGEVGGELQTITGVDLVYDAIPTNEGVFWSPVTWYDLENEKNTYNRAISILDKSHLVTAVDQVAKLLKE